MLIANYDYEIDKKVYAEEAYAEGENNRAREVALRMLEGGKLTIVTQPPF